MRKHYSAAFKAQVVQEILKEEKTIARQNIVEVTVKNAT